VPKRQAFQEALNSSGYPTEQLDWNAPHPLATYTIEHGPTPHSTPCLCPLRQVTSRTCIAAKDPLGCGASTPKRWVRQTLIGYAIRVGKHQHVV
jgi:hypothetical protein